MFLLFLMWLEGFKLHLWACIVFLLEDGSRNTFLLLLWGHVPPGGRSLQENMKNYLAAFFNRSVKPQWWKWWPLFGICLGWREGQSMMKEKSWLLREDFLGYWKPFKFYICFLRSSPCNSDLNVGGKYSCPHNTFPFWRFVFFKAMFAKCLSPCKVAHSWTPGTIWGTIILPNIKVLKNQNNCMWIQTPVHI